MLVGQKGVKYGLNVRQPAGAKPAPPPKKRSVFGDEDSEEEEQGGVEAQIARQAARKQSDKKVGSAAESVAAAACSLLPLPAAAGCSHLSLPPTKQVLDLHAAALAEDVAIFDYDSHYDAIQEVGAHCPYCVLICLCQPS